MILYGNTIINIVLVALFAVLSIRTWKKFGGCAYAMWGGLALTGTGFLLAEIFTQMQFYQTEYWIVVEFLEGMGLAGAGYFILTYESSKKCAPADAASGGAGMDAMEGAEALPKEKKKNRGRRK